jgi:predicted glutamine amidotransferase
MCRVLAYLGKPTVVDDLLYQPDNSLVRQATDPTHLHMLSLGGFGMVAWAPGTVHPERPIAYRTTALPLFDTNLKSLAANVATTCLLAHVRGIAFVPSAGHGPHNLHPFHYPGFRWALAHNGDLAGFSGMRHALLRHVRPDVAAHIVGTTDSECVYALLMSQLADPYDKSSPRDLLPALRRTLEILRDERAAHGIRQSSALNLFLTNGEGLLALRFAFDFGCYATDDPEALQDANVHFLSLWYTLGHRYGQVGREWTMLGGSAGADSVLLASEPLTRDVSGWIEVPEYTAICVTRDAGGVRVENIAMDV